MFFKFLISVVLIKSIQSETIWKIKENENVMELKMLQLISAIEETLDLRTIVIRYNATVSNCGELDLFLKYLNASVIIENIQESWLLWESLNTNILSLVCLEGLNFNPETKLQSYFHSLNSIRDTKMIFFVNHNENANQLPQLMEFLKYCLQQKSLNVVVIFKDFHHTLNLHGYKPFPKFQMVTRHYHNMSAEDIYPNHLKNLMGRDFYTLPDQIIPRTFLANSQGENVKITGYVGHFMHLLTDYMNATLKLPFPVKQGEVLFYGDLGILTLNGTLDLAATLMPLINVNQLFYFSYPFQVINACLMIPVAKDMPFSRVFFYLVNYELGSVSVANLFLFTLLLNYKRLKAAPSGSLPLPDFILNDVALRGILGQPFAVWRKAGFFTKFVYVLLSLTGLYLSLIYGAFLQSFFTHPFKQPQLRTFEDLYSNGVYALLSDTELSYFSNTDVDFIVLYRNASYAEFNDMRNSLNTSYAYPTINIHWHSLFHNQQNALKDKLFMYSEDACFFTSFLVSFPMAENSIYRRLVHKMIMITNAHGLVNYWYRSNYPEMRNDAQKFIFNATIEGSEGRALSINDLHVVFEVYKGLLLMATLIFLMEKVHFHFRLFMANTRGHK